MARIVVVGGSLGGLRTTEALFAQGWQGEVVVVGEELHAPYTRPPLSKTALAAEPDLSVLAFKQRPEAALADWRLGVRAESCDLAARTLTLSDGTELGFDGLVAATGVRPRRLPPRVCAGGLVVRTFDDSAALRSQLLPGTRVVIVGAGFIGCEIAATATKLGCEVHVVALDTAPMVVPLGESVARAVQRRHEREGVTFHLGRQLAEVTPDADGATVRGPQTVRLDDGTSLECDVVVQAIGSQPCVEWLDGNGLDLSDGVACDNWMRMGGRPGAVAVGDVARFPNPLFDDVPRRVEHWQMPGDTARRAAATLVSDLAEAPQDPEPFRPMPSFWSDQYDLRLQSFGALSIADRIEVLEGGLEGTDPEAVVGYHRGEHLVGAVLLGLPRRAAPVRRLVQDSLTAAAANSATSATTATSTAGA